MHQRTVSLALTALLGSAFVTTAQADKLDDIIGSGKLRCAVTLDFPPASTSTIATTWRKSSG